MTNRERFLAVMNYQEYDRLPLAHFGYWYDVLVKWANQGHISKDMTNEVWDGSKADDELAKMLGFDFNYFTVAFQRSGMCPLSTTFEPKHMGKDKNGFDLILNSIGCIELHREGAGSIPAEVDHILKDRKSWEEEYKPRLAFSEDRVSQDIIDYYKKNTNPDNPLGLYLGSVYGDLRNFMGVEGISYLYADDEELFAEMLNYIGDMWYRSAEKLLASDLRFDFAHFWEDICFKNGPLVSPNVFREYCLPIYKKITKLVRDHGIDIVSVDCDGMVDALIPVWLDGGVDTLFPIEVGTWDASIAPWREKYGKQIRGVGGMRKHIFEEDYAAVDREVERLRPLVELGGYIPCPDHRITPDAKWENVQYYCDKMRKIFG